MKRNVYKLEVLVVDHDGIGALGIITNLQNTNYPNDCIAPMVMDIDEAEIEWSDDHPLNMPQTHHATYKELFKKYSHAETPSQGNTQPLNKRRKTARQTP